MNRLLLDDPFEDEPDDFEDDDEDGDDDDEEDDDEDDDDVETWQVAPAAFPLRYGLRLTSGIEPA